MTDRPDVRRLGLVHDHEGKPRLVRRDHDALDLTLLTPLLRPGGVRELEQVIADYWNDLARWRAATLDLEAHGIDVGECRELLATLPFTGDDPDDLTSVDWHEVGIRLVNLRPFGGYGELARLHALLTSDDPQQHVTAEG